MQFWEASKWPLSLKLINEAGNVAAITIKEQNKVAHYPTLLSLTTCVMTLLLACGALTVVLPTAAIYCTCFGCKCTWRIFIS